MNIFLFIEHLCFKDLYEELDLIYKKELSEEIKNEIINKLVNKENKENENVNTKEDFITLKDLGAAVRRFITRYLSGSLELVNICR